MSDDIFLYYVAALIVSGLILAGCAAIGFGQSSDARLIGAVFAGAFLVYSAYLIFGDAEDVWISSYVFVAPLLGVLNAARCYEERKKARQAEAQVIDG